MIEDLVGPLEKESQGTFWGGPGRFHLRYSKAHPLREGNTVRFWWGVQQERWVGKEFLFLICGSDGVLVAPIQEWIAFRHLIPKTGDGKHLKPSVRRVESDGKMLFELRHAGERIDVTNYLDRFDLYTDQLPG